MAGDVRERHLSLGDFEVSGCCFSKKFQRLAGRRGLMTLRNVIEIESIDWRKSLDQGRYIKEGTL